MEDANNDPLSSVTDNENSTEQLLTENETSHDDALDLPSNATSDLLIKQAVAEDTSVSLQNEIVEDESKNVAEGSKINSFEGTTNTASAHDHLSIDKVKHYN